MRHEAFPHQGRGKSPTCRSPEHPGSRRKACFVTVPAPATPASDRIAAITLVVFLHALAAIHFAMSGDVGGRTGRGDRNVAGEGRETWTEANFVPRQAAPAPTAATSEAPPPHSEAADASASGPVPPSQANAALSHRAPSEAARQDGGGNGAPQDDLGARYLAAVRAAVIGQWSAQGGGAIPEGCGLVIEQAAGGRALRAWVVQCGDLPLVERIRLETAVMQVQPLPYEGFEPVFRERVELVF